MDSGLKDLYDKLMNIDKLTKKNYDEFVSLYGVKNVNNMIDYIMESHKDIIGKFDYYVSLSAANIESVVGMSILQYYINDMHRIPMLNVAENEMYSKQVYQIICELRKIFSTFEQKYVKKKDIIYNSILDEVAFYSSICEDIDVLNKMKELSNQFIDIRNKLVEGNARIVIAAYKNRYKDDSSYLELLQYGNIGLMKAVERFNPKRGVLFSTYAYYVIKHFFRMANRQYLHTGVSVSYYAMEQNNLRLKVIEELTTELMRTPTSAEICERMGITQKMLDAIECSVPYSRVLSDSFYGGDDEERSISLLDMCADDSVNVEEEACYKILRPQLLEVVKSDLSERQMFILMKRCGFDGEPLTFREIGELLNLSKQCVEQDLARGLRKVRKNSYSRLQEFLD